jgi:hypothetical protein
MRLHRSNHRERLQCIDSARKISFDGLMMTDFSSALGARRSDRMRIASAIPAPHQAPYGPVLAP